jgi:eukaryotic-like serine/threonine-protein kinase
MASSEDDPAVTKVGTPPTAPASSVAADPLIGTVLADRYEIVRRIGEGGMGAVYEGRHTVLGRPVAVKVLLEKFHDRTELVARLLQEARLASAIGHENIVDVTDFGTTSDGRAFVVMEFLEGESLAELVIRDAPLAVERCLRMARQVASALGAAHGKGIVHRDVKPENVFLLRRGEQDFVKVVDFGVSKAVRSRDDGAELTRLTRTGMVLGTPLYMSPEQARGGEDVDARADIWALGVMLYECLTGEVPFRANNYLAVISQVLTQDVLPPSKLRPELGIPPAVETIVMRAMEKDREKRYQSMAELERDLDRILAGDPNVGLPHSEAAPAAPSPPTGARWHLGIAAIVVVGVGLALSLARTEEEARSRALQRPPPQVPGAGRHPAMRAVPSPPQAAVFSPLIPPVPAAVPARATGVSGPGIPSSRPQSPSRSPGLPSAREPGSPDKSAEKSPEKSPPSIADQPRPRRPGRARKSPRNTVTGTGEPAAPNPY